MLEQFAPILPYTGKIYVGLLGDTGPQVEVYKGTAALGRLKPRRDLWIGVDCPERFAWGVGGDRDSYLSLALLADALGPDVDRIRDLYIPFRANVIDKLSPFRTWQLTYCQVSAQLASIEDVLAAKRKHHGL